MKYNEYQDTKPYKEMSKSEKELFDHIGNTGFMRGNASREIEAWKVKRASMTQEELEEMKQKDELDKWTGKWMLIGFGIVLAVACTLLIIGELTGNSLTENFTGVWEEITKE